MMDEEAFDSIIGTCTSENLGFFSCSDSVKLMSSSLVQMHILSMLFF